MPRRPRDLNQLAKLVVDIASGEVADTVSPQMRSQDSVRGRAGGEKGGAERARKMTPEQRSAIAKAAAQARWEKK